MCILLKNENTLQGIAMMKKIKTVGRETEITDFILGMMTEKKVPSTKKNSWIKNMVIEIIKKILASKESVETNLASTVAIKLKTILTITNEVRAASNLLVMTLIRLTGFVNKKSTVLPLCSFERALTPRFMPWTAPARHKNPNRYAKKP